MFADSICSDSAIQGSSGWDEVVCEGGEITMDNAERDAALQDLMGSEATEIAAKWAESGRMRKKLEVMLAEGQLKGRDHTMVRRLLGLPAEPALSVTLKPLNVKLFNAQLKAKLAAKSEDSDEETEDEEEAEERGRTAEALFGRLAGIDVRKTWHDDDDSQETQANEEVCVAPRPASRHSTSDLAHPPDEGPGTRKHGEAERCSGRNTPSSSGLMTPPPTVKRPAGLQAHVAERSDPYLDSHPAQKRPADVDSEPFSSINNNSLAQHRQPQEECSIRPTSPKRRKVVDWLSNVQRSSAYSTESVSPQDRDENQRSPSQSIRVSLTPSLAAHRPTGSPVVSATLLQLPHQPAFTDLDHSAKIHEDPTAKKARHRKFREGRLAITEKLRLARPDLPRPAHSTYISGPDPEHGKKSAENRRFHPISKVDRNGMIHPPHLQTSHPKEHNIDSAKIGPPLRSSGSFATVYSDDRDIDWERVRYLEKQIRQNAMEGKRLKVPRLECVDSQ